ncbi:N,N'-diacetyllegionaminate synthase [Methanococcus voltae]|uniref:N,N'-diacetyllegionaminate synthase n=1 Tax=Methanococcus voltae TaxID=2188 RepID=A0A8J7RGH0_METVO|nr:N-acetylneuraminate synthase family protein [Methanococcus voltae]MBP2201427.1 N,N'-diacetyllegionaminate synthase [Methanococcus voltae]
MNTSDNIINNLEPHLILELANAHGGNVGYINNIIEQFSKIDYNNKGIKFQPFKYDKIALKDFSWYEVYEKLYIAPQEWADIIKLSKKSSFNVWLDIFDTYGCDILTSNFDDIYGVKLQASIVNNLEVFELFKEYNFEDKQLIINISGFAIDEIKEIVEKYSQLNFNSIVLQVGFQAYPTKIDDTSLNKIKILKAAFPNNKICYADHLPAEEKFSTLFPALAFNGGCDYIEKHICLDRANTEYDFYSALEKDQVMEVIDNLKNVLACSVTDFISESERNYLEKTEQIPIIKSNLKKGQLISEKDVIYRRTNKTGIRYKEIVELQKSCNILASELIENDVVTKNSYKKANIGVVVAGRMKSSRLKKKAILPINGIPSVERCLMNCLKIENTSKVVLASSTLQEDEVLKDYTLNGNVEFFQGDPDDVISRFLGVADENDLDVIIRVTADCPVVSSEIANILLDSHFRNGADYTAPKNFAVGTNCEIYNVEMLKRIIELLGDAKYSEYMTWYAQNNPNIFKVNMVDLPEEYIRSYRLTLDYPEDLVMFEELFKKLELENKEPSLKNIFEVLDNNLEIPKINGDLTLVYKTDEKLIEKLNKVTKITINKNNSKI